MAVLNFETPSQGRSVVCEWGGSSGTPKASIARRRRAENGGSGGPPPEKFEIYKSWDAISCRLGANFNAEIILGFSFVTWVTDVQAIIFLSKILEQEKTGS